MFEIREVVVVAVNDHTTIFNQSGVEPVGRCPANRFCESECEETNTGHE